MVAAAKWLWGKILAFCKLIFKFTRDIYGVVVTILSSALSWVIATVAYVLDLLFGWIGDVVENMFESLETINIPGVQWLPFAQWLACDVCALDVAYTSFAVFFSVWVATRLVRGSWTAIRVVLDII